MNPGSKVVLLFIGSSMLLMRILSGSYFMKPLPKQLITILHLFLTRRRLSLR